MLLDLGFIPQQIVYDFACRDLNNDLNELGRRADWTLEEFKFFLSSDGELNTNGIWYFQQDMDTMDDETRDLFKEISEQTFNISFTFL